MQRLYWDDLGNDLDASGGASADTQHFRVGEHPDGLSDGWLAHTWPDGVGQLVDNLGECARTHDRTEKRLLVRVRSSGHKGKGTALGSAPGCRQFPVMGP